MMRTANPALNENTFDKVRPASMQSTDVMTVDGAVNKTGFLLLCTIATAFYVWRMFFSSTNPAVVVPWMLGGMIGGLIVAIVTVFKKNWSAITAPLYALLEGFMLGGLSAFLELRFPGIVMQAVALTFGTLFALLMAYKSRLIRATENFKLGVVAATGAIGLFYLIAMVLGFFGVRIAFLHEGSWLGIGFSVFVVVIAALNLVLDFDFIETGAERGVPKYMEWYAAFGLMVTLIWLYVEILRLLSKLRDRR